MGLSKKGKRQIVVNDRRFYWCIANGLSGIGGDVLKIISEDKSVLCYYPLFDLHGKNRFMIACGELLGGEAIDKRGRRSYQCPRWENEDWSITPRGVSKFIEWCLSCDRKLVEVDGLTGAEQSAAPNRMG